MGTTWKSAVKYVKFCDLDFEHGVSSRRREAFAVSHPRGVPSNNAQDVQMYQLIYAL